MLAGMAAAVWVAYEVCAVVAEYIWWIVGTLAVCFALAVAASMALEAWADPPRGQVRRRSWHLVAR